MSKKIENRKVTLEVEQNVKGQGLIDVKIEATYFELIFGACKRPSDPRAGYTWDDIEKINRVKSLYDKSKEEGVTEVECEDSDYDFIMDRVETNTWATISHEILEFRTYLKNLKSLKK